MQVGRMQRYVFIAYWFIVHLSVHLISTLNEGIKDQMTKF